MAVVIRAGLGTCLRSANSEALMHQTPVSDPRRGAAVASACQAYRRTSIDSPITSLASGE